ncbi:hypothetical protein B0H14DRAFT_2599950 [Mycena olivaceomarginata]|nr:hypothetical protein B0H14DRAFT_2599950 [Mycena olivaceomarginata]
MREDNTATKELYIVPEKLAERNTDSATDPNIANIDFGDFKGLPCPHHFHPWRNSFVPQFKMALADPRIWCRFIRGVDPTAPRNMSLRERMPTARALSRSVDHRKCDASPTIACFQRLAGSWMLDVSETSKAGFDVTIFSTWFPRAQRSATILASRREGGSLDRIMSQSHETKNKAKEGTTHVQKDLYSLSQKVTGNTSIAEDDGH